MTNDPIAYVNGSWGSLVINNETGRVITCTAGEYIAIIEFDLKEYDQYWNEPRPKNYDILDLGFWHRIDQRVEYTPPEYDWRKYYIEEVKGWRHPQ